MLQWLAFHFRDRQPGLKVVEPLRRRDGWVVYKS